MNSHNKPAPKWYRITKSIWGQTENLVIAIWMIYQPADSPVLLVFKLCSSFIKETLDIFLVSNTEEYAVKEPVEKAL